MISAARSKSMFSSCSPTSALVAGVKIGSASLSDSCRPSGSSIPQTVCSDSLVLLPARAGEVAADDALDRVHLEPLDPQRAAGDLVGDVGRDQVVGADVLGLAEPEDRHLGQHRALAGDRRRHHDVVGGDPVGGDHQQVVPVLVHVPDLAAVERLHFSQCGHHAESSNGSCRCCGHTSGRGAHNRTLRGKRFRTRRQRRPAAGPGDAEAAADGPPSGAAAPVPRALPPPLRRHLHGPRPAHRAPSSSSPTPTRSSASSPPTSRTRSRPAAP